MIQAMVAMRGSASERGEPLPATNAAGLSMEPAAQGLQGFDQRMSELGQQAEPVAADLLLALAEGVVESAPDEPTQLRGDLWQGAEQAEAQTNQDAAEQWLLGVLDQQALQVRARSAEPEQAPLVAQPALRSAGSEADVSVSRERQPAMPLPVDREQYAAAERAAPAQPEMPREMNWKAAAPVAGKAEMQGFVQAQPKGEPAPAVTAAPVAANAEPAAAGQTIEQPLLAVERGQAAPAASVERTLSLPAATQARWGEQMLHALREHVDLQVQQKVQNATIRLDPPELGSLEIMLSHESGRLTVQLSAANADVARLLQQTSDRLRQELVAQHFVQVNVQVSADSGQGRQGQPQRPPALADADPAFNGQRPAAEEGAATPRGLRDVLVTV